ncbi:MAG: ATP synthase F1 subunit epsilon [Candidatus Falkowbacteria bacterium]
MPLKTIKFEIVTPEQTVLKEAVVRATIPTQSGEVTILPDHIPLVSVLKPGIVEVEKADGSLDLMVVSGGFLEVMSGKIVILADYAERAAGLNEDVILEAQTKAEKAKLEAKNRDDIDFADTEARLEVELFKTRALSRWRKLKNLDK